MASEWDDDVDEIVVDDKPREDGLSGEVEPQAVPARVTEGASPELEMIAAAIPRILERLEELSQQPVAVDTTEEDRTSVAFNELTGRMDEVVQRLAGLEQRLDDQAKSISAPTGDAIQNNLSQDEDAVAATEAVFSESLPPGDAQFTPASEDRDIEQLVFGEELCQDHVLTGSRQQLLDGVRDRKATAICLAARLMLVQAAGADELPALLKEIGEAYYRWHPKTTDSEELLEESLVKKLEKRIAAVGLRNSIEVIRQGDRYDAARHVSPDRGVEVAEVRGWVVLRDNGKPLTKASVGLR